MRKNLLQREREEGGREIGIAFIGWGSSPDSMAPWETSDLSGGGGCLPLFTLDMAFSERLAISDHKSRCRLEAGRLACGPCVEWQLVTVFFGGLTTAFEALYPSVVR